MPDYYAILGVDERTSAVDIEAAYRRLAARYHATNNPQNWLAAQRYRAVVEAFAELGDPARRAAYDDRLAGAAPYEPLPALHPPAGDASCPAPRAAPGPPPATGTTRGRFAWDWRLPEWDWMRSHPKWSGVLITLFLALVLVEAVGIPAEQTTHPPTGRTTAVVAVATSHRGVHAVAPTQAAPTAALPVPVLTQERSKPAPPRRSDTMLAAIDGNPPHEPGAVAGAIPVTAVVRRVGGHLVVTITISGDYESRAAVP